MDVRVRRATWLLGALSFGGVVVPGCSGEATSSSDHGGTAGVHAGGIAGKDGTGARPTSGGAQAVGGAAGDSADGGFAAVSGGANTNGGLGSVNEAGQRGTQEGGAGGSESGGNSAGGSKPMGGAGGGASGGAPCLSEHELRCAGQCIDVTKSKSHCGDCNQACAADLVCVSGACACPAGRSECGGVCADFQSDALHCGSCATACRGNRICSAGSCVCAPGQSVCSDTCIDPQTNRENCGGCGNACGLGEACSAGKCAAAPGGALDADSCSGLADGLTLTAVSTIQSVEVPIMRNGTEVALASRNADIVAGRETLVRLFANVDSGWVSRTLSARVLVENAGHIDMYFAKRQIYSSQTFSYSQASFEIRVPKEKVNAGTRYRLEVVECGRKATGPTLGAQFPSSGGLSLGARVTGGLKVKVLPLRANGLVPDTSVAALEIYKRALLEMYPIASAELSVGVTLDVTDAYDWNAMLDRVRAQRAADAPASDVYYYGMIRPTATLQEYCAGKSPCTAGLGYLVSTGTVSTQASQRAAIGLAYADATSSETMLHELGHNHGRGHAPCSQAGSLTDVDAAYPYSSGTIGVYGWNSRTGSVVYNYSYDIMSYCSSRWISDYTYAGILNRVASVNGALATDVVPPELVQRWRVLLLDGSFARWGQRFERAAAPAGEPEAAELLDEHGQPIARVAVFRSTLPDIDGASIQVPEPQPGWAAIRVAGAPPIAYER